MNFIISWIIKTAAWSFMKKYARLFIAGAIVLVIALLFGFGYYCKSAIAERDVLRATVGRQQAEIERVIKINDDNLAEAQSRENRYRKELADMHSHYDYEAQQKREYYADLEDIKKTARENDDENCSTNPAFITVADQLRKQYGIRDSNKG